MSLLLLSPGLHTNILISHLSLLLSSSALKQWLSRPVVLVYSIYQNMCYLNDSCHTYRHIGRASNAKKQSKCIFLTISPLLQQPHRGSFNWLSAAVCIKMIASTKVLRQATLLSRKRVVADRLKPISASGLYVFAHQTKKRDNSMSNWRIERTLQ